MQNFPWKPYCIFTSLSTKHFQSNSLCQHLAPTAELLLFLTPFRIQGAGTQIQSIMDLRQHSLNAAPQYTHPQHQQWDWYRLNSGENAAFTNHFADDHVSGFRSGQILTILPSLIALTPVVQIRGQLTLTKKFKICCHHRRGNFFSPFLCKSLNPDKAPPSNMYLANLIIAEKDPKKLFLSNPLVFKCYAKSPAMLVDGKPCRWQQKFSKLEVRIRLTVCLYKMPWNIPALRRLFQKQT